MKQIHYLIFILLCGLLLPIYAAEIEIPDDVAKLADKQMEDFVSKQGRRIGSAERSTKTEPEAKTGATLYKFHYRFSYGTFGCTMSVRKKGTKLTVTEKPSCYENEMP